MAISNSISDSELVKKLRKGDIEAFDQVFKKYGNRLFGFALSYLKSKEETEGLVQNVFLKLWENRKKLKQESSLKSYLFTIAYHQMCQIFRKKQIHEKFLKEKITSVDTATDLEEMLEYKATLEQIEKLINKLPEKQRLVFIKSRNEGKSSKEIAAEMNLAPGTVDNLISLALKFLRQHLSDASFCVLLFFAFFIQ